MPVAKKSEEKVTISPPNIKRMVFRIEGTAQFVQLKFSQKSRDTMMARMSTPAAAKKTKAARSVRDYGAEFIAAQHIAVDGWNGIPAAAFRTAMIDACRTVGLAMTKAKMAVFVIPDGFDAEDGTPLVRLTSSAAPEKLESHVRNDTGVADVRIRAVWREWTADVMLEFDADMVDTSSVANLLNRAGWQVGIGEGRPFSKSSTGQGWGTFRLVTGEQPR